MADDMLAKAIDDINWTEFHRHLNLSDSNWYGVFTCLDFLGAIFIEFQKLCKLNAGFHDHI